MWKLIVTCSAETIPRVREVLSRFEDALTERDGDPVLELRYLDKDSAAAAGRLVKKKLRKDVSCEIIP